MKGLLVLPKVLIRRSSSVVARLAPNQYSLALFLHDNGVPIYEGDHERRLLEDFAIDTQVPSPFVPWEEILVETWDCKRARDYCWVFAPPRAQAGEGNRGSRYDNHER